MNQKEFDESVLRNWKASGALLVSKGEEYAGSEDRLANFKRAGDNLGVDPLVALGIYAGKHWDSIQTYIRKVSNGETPKLSEPIEGRFHDLINYCFLAIALVEERADQERTAFNVAAELKKQLAHTSGNPGIQQAKSQVAGGAYAHESYSGVKSETPPGVTSWKYHGYIQYKAVLLGIYTDNTGVHQLAACNPDIGITSPTHSIALSRSEFETLVNQATLTEYQAKLIAGRFPEIFNGNS